MNHDSFWQFCGLLLSLLLAANLWMYLRVMRPIQELAARANKLSTGDFTVLETDCGGIPEIQILRRSMASMVKHVRRAQQQSIKYADNLIEAQEAERLRLAHELHDDTIQSLIAISQSIDIAKTLGKSMPAEVLQILNTARGQAIETVNNLRNLIEALRPPVLEELGLIAALESLAEKSELSVELSIEGPERRLDALQELSIFRCVQEALSNAQRHSQAKHLSLRLSYHLAYIQIAVSDDGKGFVLLQDLSDLADSGHYGLLGIQERTKQVGGSLKIHSTVGKGTYLLLNIPTVVGQQPENMVRDPVCSAIIQPQQAYASSLYEGQRYYFCCPICQGAFHKEPERFVHQEMLSNISVDSSLGEN